MIYEFNNLRLNSDQFSLELEGERVSVEPLAFDLLVYLLEHRDRVVSRDELFENLWSGKIVTDAALAARLKDARKAVQDNGRKQAVIKTIHGRGFQFVAKVSEIAKTSSAQTVSDSRRPVAIDDQGPIRYCRSSDGVSIAHTQVGQGYPLFVTGSWMTHLQEDWKNPSWGPYISHLAEDFTVIRYDQRGNGMSEWEGVDINFDRMVDDLAAVVDKYDYEKFAIFGPSQAAAVSIAYAMRNPERVSHLVLYGGYSRGRCRRGNPAGAAESNALVTLIRQSWGNENPAIRQTITSLMMPDASREEADWFNEFQRTCGPAENIARFREIFDDIDVADLLDEITVPTLVAHTTGDSVSPLSEGKLLASRIPDARLITFNSKNHMMFENEPEFARLMTSIKNFLKQPAG